MIVDNIFWDKQKFLMRLLKNTQTGILNIFSLPLLIHVKLCSHTIQFCP